MTQGQYVMLTAEQIETRRAHVGSSDAAAICGLDPYRSAIDVFTEKTLETDDIVGNEAIDIGNRLEPVLLAWACEQLNQFQDYQENCPAVHDNGILAANLDAYIDEDHHIEAKTTGITEGWGDPDVPNDVPEKVLVQTHHQFACAGTRIAWVPVLIGAFGLHFRLYKVERNEDVLKSVTERCTAFWHDYVEKRIAPPDSLPSLEVAKRIRRVANKIVTSSQVPKLDQLVRDFEKANTERKASEKHEEQCKAALYTAMGDAEELRCDAGWYTLFEQSRKGFVVQPTTFRVLRPAKKPKRK